MTFYRFTNIKYNEFFQELHRFFSKRGMKTPISSKEIIKFERGSMWAITSKNFYVQGKIRIITFDDKLECKIDFDRTKIWLANALVGLGYFALILIFSIVSFFQALNLEIETSFYTSLIATVLIAFSISIIFGELYLVNKAEKIFVEEFESWFSSFF